MAQAGCGCVLVSFSKERGGQLKPILLMALLLAMDTHAEGANYKSLKPSCRSCTQLDDIITKHNTELSPDERLDMALDVATVIEKISIKSKNQIDQKREIYFAINSTLQVLPDDFDSATVVWLMDLRTQAPKQFDYVFWRFPIGEQKQIVERMKAAKADKIRSKAQIPEAKSVE
jgi:hypothetical protein